MLRFASAALLLLLSACGESAREDALEDAANQSGPAAAAVLENAAENGMDPQAALEQAGEAAAQAQQQEPQSTLQAKPNLPQDPNRPTGGQPPAKVDVEANTAANEQAADEHAGHNME